MQHLIKVGERDIKIQGQLVRLARIDGEKFLFLDDPEPILDGLRKGRERVDLFTFLQRLPDTAPKFSYPMEMDNLAVVPVSTFDHWWTKQIGFKARNKAKQAGKKGVTVREAAFDDALVRGIWEVYNECPVRQGAPFHHYGMDLETVRKHAGTFPDSSIFIGAYFEEKLIGFIKLTCDETRTQAGLMDIVSMVGHKDKAPTNALVAQAVRSCADRGIPYLVYSNFAYGKKETSSLSDFKERNGFERIDLPRYYVPLSPVGRLALRLGLHRRLVDRIPEPVVAKLRELRKAWYDRRFHEVTEVS